MGLSVTVAAGFVALLLLAALVAIGANRHARQPVNRFAPTNHRSSAGRRRSNDPTDGTPITANPWIYSSAFGSGGNADCAPDAGSSSGADCGSSGDGGGGGGGGD